MKLDSEKSGLLIEVVFCSPTEQTIIKLTVKQGCTAWQAVQQSKLIVMGSGESVPIGIFGKKCAPETLLKAGDRVEIYRPLLLSPVEARRLRAKTLSQKQS